MRLGKNLGRYQGETIDIAQVTQEIHQAALGAGWASETFLDNPPLRLRAYRRTSPGAEKRLYLSTGIHGDEPAGPLAVLELLRQNAWPPGLDLWLCPCLNPAGFSLNTRENERGIDLNRDYRHLATEEVRAHVGWLSRQPKFDLSLILHEDWEAGGFYLYEQNPTGLPSLAEKVIEAVAPVCPIETAEVVDTWEARGGIIRPKANPEERPQWAEALYLVSRKSRLGYTLETPSDFPLPIRVAAQLRAVQTALQWL